MPNVFSTSPRQGPRADQALVSGTPELTTYQKRDFDSPGLWYDDPRDRKKTVSPNSPTNEIAFSLGHSLNTSIIKVMDIPYIRV